MIWPVNSVFHYNLYDKAETHVGTYLEFGGGLPVEAAERVERCVRNETGEVRKKRLRLFHFYRKRMMRLKKLLAAISGSVGRPSLFMMEKKFWEVPLFYDTCNTDFDYHCVKCAV